MATSTPSAFRRAFRRRELFRGAPRRAFLWSVLAALLLVLLLFTVFLLIDLLVHQGRLSIVLEDQQIELFERRTGIPIRRDDEPSSETYRKIETNSGILPTVWWSHDRWWGGAVSACYRSVPTLRRSFSALLTLLGLGAVLIFCRRLVLERMRNLAWLTALDTATWLRRSVHRQALRIVPGDLEGKESEHAFDLFTNAADRVQQGLAQWISGLTRAPLELAALAFITLALHWLLALQWMIPLALGGYLFVQVRRRQGVLRRAAEDQAQRNLRLLSEAMRRPRLVRGYGMENFEHEQFQLHLQRYRDAQFAEQRFPWSRVAVSAGVLALATFLVYLLTVKVLANPNELPLAAALTFLTAFGLMWWPAEQVVELQGARDEVDGAASHIFRFLDRIPAVGQAVGAKFLQPLSKTLHFESVVYALPNKRRLLNGLDLKLDAGRTYAIVSLDSLEARALVSLLPRFIEPQSGRVLLDGEDIAWVTLESLRAETIYVSAADPPFTGTVLENIRCGRDDYTLPQITEAAKQTHAHSFITRLYNGYETVIGEHGERLDAGQNLRLALARAILRDPALLIIEEPWEPLDDDTKALLEDAYTRITPGRTVLFLPSRLATLRRADQVILLRNGKVEAVGNHVGLVRESPLYRHWEYTRFNEFRHDEGGG